MKKHLIAAAVAAAVAVPAMAQVTVYGGLDTGIANFDSGAAGVSSFTRSVNNVYYTSRLGFRGTEDLGGGLKAMFQLERTLGPSEGLDAKPAAGSAATGGVFDRESIVGISGSFGEIVFGLTDLSDAQGLESIVGQAGNMSDALSIDGSSEQEGSDTKNAIRYTLPELMKGLTVKVGYASGNDFDATSDGRATEMSLSAVYRSGPLTVGVGFATVDGATAVAEEDFMTFGASYDFGVASVGLYYGSGDAETDSNSEKTKQTILSAKIPLQDGLSVQGAYHSLRHEATTNQKANGTTLALVKDFSKRTSAYGFYQRIKNGAAAAAFGGAIVVAPTAGNDPSAFGFGIVHKF